VEPARIVDVRGRACPVPVLELAKAIGEVEAGDVVEVRADDPTAKVDVPVWCRMRGQSLLGRRDLEDGGWAFRVERRD
jgi:TusA-related sulfurtransferase